MGVGSVKAAWRTGKWAWNTDGLVWVRCGISRQCEMFHNVMDVNIVLKEENTKRWGKNRLFSFEIALRCFSSAEMNCNFGGSLFVQVRNEGRGERGLLFLKKIGVGKIPRQWHKMWSCVKLHKGIAHYTTDWSIEKRTERGRFVEINLLFFMLRTQSGAFILRHYCH